MGETARQCFAVACLAGAMVLLTVVLNNLGSDVTLPTIMVASPELPRQFDPTNATGTVNYRRVKMLRAFCQKLVTNY